MSGYEGAGTFEAEGPDGPDGANVGYGFEWGGPAVADSNIGFSGSGLSLASKGVGLSAAPGAGLQLAAPGGPGLSVNASQFAGFGPSDAPSLGIETSSAVQSARAGLAVAQSSAASAAAASAAKTKATITQGVSLLPGGGLLVAAGQFVSNLFDALFGSTSSAPATAATATGSSLAPDLFPGGDGPPDTGFAGGAPVLGFGGSAVNNTPAAGGVITFPGLSYGATAPGGGLQYGAGFVPGAQAGQSSLAPLALLAGAASLLFMG